MLYGMILPSAVLFVCLRVELAWFPGDKSECFVLKRKNIFLCGKLDYFPLLYYEEKYKLLFKNVWSTRISSADYKGHLLAACSGFQAVRKAVHSSCVSRAELPVWNQLGSGQL